MMECGKALHYSNQGVPMKKAYARPTLMRSAQLSAVTAGANFSGKKAKPVQQP
jgi:hypothetical protein